MSERSTRTFNIRISNLEELAPLRKLVGEGQFEELVAGIGSQVAENLRQQRDPETGEFPVVTTYPISDSTLRVEIDGTDRLHEFLQRRLPEIGFELSSADAVAEAPKAAAEPKKYVAFLAHANDDHAFALRIAGALHAQGIATFIDDWELRSGDSIRQKLAQGIADCTHFIVLLTPVSLGRPWVKTEIDAGFIRMLAGQARFVGIRCGVAPDELDPFLQTLWLPKIHPDTFDEDMTRILGDIVGVSRRPPLGPLPPYAQSRVPDLSPVAAAVAQHFVQNTKYARDFDPQVTIAELVKLLLLPEDDLIDAYDELKGLGCLRTFDVIGGRRVSPSGPTERLFVRFDRYWMAWDPARDAIVVAHALQDASDGSTEKLMKKLGWEVRRMNPALAYLIDRDLVTYSESISHPLATHWIQANDETRRFLKGQS